MPHGRYIDEQCEEYFNILKELRRVKYSTIYYHVYHTSRS